jgi:hypothetical protein
VTFSDNVIPGDCDGNYTIERTWTATDACGNSSSCLQIISVDDTVPPVIACPGDVSLECVIDLDTSPSATGSATATDACDPAPVVTFSDNVIPGNCPGNYTIERTWTATDACGNSTACLQVISVDDTVPPVITCPSDALIECALMLDTSPGATGIATATDACDPNPAVTFNDVVIPGNCPGMYTIERTWTAMDACGNSSSCLQVIVIDDTVPPVITCPADVSLECMIDLDTSPGATGSATATDICDPNPLVAFTDNVVAGNCPGNFVIERTWVAMDICGNTASCLQLITITDTSPPSIICPPDASFECVTDFDTSPANTGSAVATDACDPNPVVTFADIVIPGDCTGNFTIERTWTVTDACGNNSSCLQVINVSDNTPPVITCPPDASLECIIDLDTSPAATGTATAIDGCDSNPAITFSDNVIPGNCPGDFTIERTWTATDACGNESTCVQIISVSDNTPPVITCPADVSFDCLDEVDVNPDNTGFAIASDVCDSNPLVTFNDNVIQGNCPGVTTIERTWTATDACGNESTCLQTISVSDTAPPAITCPSDAMVICGDITTPDVLGSATAIDACDPQPVINFSDVSNIDICGLGSISRTWIATDCSGNSASCIQTISIDDSEIPEITCPQNVAFDCEIGDAGIPSVQDNCDPQPSTGFNDVNNLDICGIGTITRTWTVTDCAGNSNSCQQLITISDNEPPSFTCPPDIQIECDESIAPSNTGDVGDATDDCDQSPTVTFADDVSPGSCPQASVIIRTWTVSDCSGNSSSCTQTITIVDTTSPIITCPGDEILPADPENCQVSYVIPEFTVSDNCAPTAQIDISVTISSIIGSFQPGDIVQLDTGTYTITALATDPCDNASLTCNYNVTVIDAEQLEAVCQDLVIPLGANGNVSITPEQVDNGSSGALQI